MNTADFDYELPEERIAQTPAEPRDSSRLLVLDRASGQRTHTHFAEIGAFLRPHDLLVANHSRVLPARLFGRKLPGGGAVEVLLVEQIEPQRWKALVGGKGLRPGRQIELGQGLIAQVLEEGERSERVLHFNRPLHEALDALGQMPLPPYIHAELQDKERYQTVYSRQTGSVAAPTAGLHFTPELLSLLQAQGVGFAEVLLHVGLDTFAPVHEEDPSEHHIHTEWCSLPAATAAATQAARAAGGRTVAVGTTSVRTLESAARSTGSVQPYEGRTDIYILPGYRFNAVDAMITNFHLPRSTLLMLVSAFVGRELILDTYREAITLNYRFYSFGDAMLIV